MEDRLDMRGTEPRENSRWAAAVIQMRVLRGISEGYQ